MKMRSFRIFMPFIDECQLLRSTEFPSTATQPKRWREPEIDLSISSVNPRKDEEVFGCQLVDDKDPSTTATSRELARANVLTVTQLKRASPEFPPTAT